MDILIDDGRLRKLCEEEKTARRKLGSAAARKLRARLADIAAATSVSELVVGKPHPLKGDRVGQFAITIDGGLRLVFEPANEPLPKRSDGSIDWPRVTRVRIVLIGDYHD